MKLYLIRHAQPELLIYSGFPGPGLGVLGVQQSYKIRDFLKDKNIGLVFISDYKRVIETVKPFLENNSSILVSIQEALRERENEIETHDELESRVKGWFNCFYKYSFNQDTAIFGHCGSINMILFYLIDSGICINLPFTDQFKCHTPIGGIWELTFNREVSTKGELIFIGD